MKVRVKEGQVGFIYNEYRTEGDEFTLKPVTHSVELDSKGNPLVITPDKQFSAVWMEKIDSRKTRKPISKDEE